MAQANPFDKFDDPANTPSITSVAPPQGQSAPAMPQNTFEQMEQGAPPPALADLTEDEFNAEVYERLNRGDSPEDIIAWSTTTPFTIVDSMDFRRNVMARDEARRLGTQPSYGRIQHHKSGATTHRMGNLDTLGLMASRMGNMALFNFGDEALAAGMALADGGDVGENYRRRHREIAELDDVMAGVNPGAATAGDVLGIGASMLLPGAVADDLIMRSMARKGITHRGAQLGARVGTGAAAGTVYGAVAGTGVGTPDDRFKNTGGGALIGGTMGASFPLVFALFNRVSRPIREMLSPQNAKALEERTALTPDELRAMEAKLQEGKELGLDYTLLDILPERARRIIGQAGRQDGARETLQEFASTRTEQLPGRVARVAEEEMMPSGAGVDPRFARMTDEEIQRGIIASRNERIERELEPIRFTPLPVTDEIMDILGTATGQRAIQRIIDNEPNAARRQAYMELMDQAKKMGQAKDPRLSESAQQAAIEQIRTGTNFDLDMSERIGRELNTMASTGEFSPGVREMGRIVRSAAEVSPEYRRIMTNYGAASRSVDAVTVGSGRNTVMDENGNIRILDDEGGGFLSEEAVRFQERFNRLLEEAEKDIFRRDIPIEGKLEVRRDYGDSKSVLYTAPDGTSVTADIRLINNGETAYVAIIGNPSNWANDKNLFDKKGVIDMSRAFARLHPQVKEFKGGRITGKHAEEYRRQENDPMYQIGQLSSGRGEYDILENIRQVVRHNSSEAENKLLADIPELSPGGLRTIELRLRDKIEDLRTHSQATPQMREDAQRALDYFLRAAGPRIKDAPKRISQIQIVPAPRQDVRVTQPRVEVRGTPDMMEPDPADAARLTREQERYDRDVEAFESAIVTDETGQFARVPNMDNATNRAMDTLEESVVGIADTAQAQRVVDGLTGDQLYAMRNALHERYQYYHSTNNVRGMEHIQETIDTLERFAGDRIQRASQRYGRFTSREEQVQGRPLPPPVMSANTNSLLENYEDFLEGGFAGDPDFNQYELLSRIRNLSDDQYLAMMAEVQRRLDMAERSGLTDEVTRLNAVRNTLPVDLGRTPPTAPSQTHTMITRRVYEREQGNPRANAPQPPSSSGEIILSNTAPPEELDRAIADWMRGRAMRPVGGAAEFTEDQQRIFDRVNEAVLTRGTPVPQLLHRGLAFNSRDEVLEFLRNPNRNRQPFSTTEYDDISNVYAQQGDVMVQLNITPTANTRGLAMTDEFGDADEIILPRGSLRVTNVQEWPEDNVWHIDAEFVPQPQPAQRRATIPAPSEQNLARIGATNQVRRRALQSPEAAARLASQMSRNPEQRQRTATMFGNRAGRIENRMRGELERVNVARRQTSPEGPGRDGTMDGMESGVNVLYNPESPISWARESMRLLSRIGMSPRTAQNIVNMATDPARVDDVIKELEKFGMRREQAMRWLDEFRDASVKYSVSQEGNPYAQPR